MSNNNNEDKSGSLYSLHKLCGELANESSHSGKTQLIKSFTNVFKGDLYLLAKLMLCKEDKRVFRIKDKAMLKICAHIWDADLDDMIADLDHGDFTETCKKFYIEYGKYPEKSTLTLKEVDGVLDSLTVSGKFDDQVKIISKLLKRSTPFDFRLICRIIDSDLKINTGAKFFLDALHPQAYDAFKKANNLKGVIEKIQQHDFDDNKNKNNNDEDEDDDEDYIDTKGTGKGGKGDKKKSAGKASFDVGIKLMTPVKPMLPKAVKNVDSVMASSESFFAEIKYDGERIQIHKDGNQFSCYSRNLKPLMPWKVDEVKSYIPKATKAQQMILDGEILLMDTKTSVPLPFGTLGVHKKNGFVDATVCVFLFDILYLNGKSLIHLPLEERREILVKNVTVIKNRVEFSEVTVVNGKNEKSKLTALLNRAFKEKLEGLVIKDSVSMYEPGCRHWIKIKKDYLAGMADSADLIVVGGYYGTGSSGGLITVFLMVCYDKPAKNYKTVVKATGFDDPTVAKLQPKLIASMNKISKDMSKIPSWLDVHKQYAPDFIVKDIKQAMIFEIESAELTKSDHHSTGYSMRFPRIISIRKDKDYKTATTLQELMEIGKDAKIIPYKSSGGTSTNKTTTTTTTASSVKSAAKSKKQLKSDDEQEDDEDEEANVNVKVKDEQDEDEESTSSTSTSKLIYVNGDVTTPFVDSGDESSKTFILNYIDNTGKWNEKGLSGAIAKKWSMIPKAFNDEIVKSGSIRVEKAKSDTNGAGDESTSGKKILICNVSCIIPPKSKKESYSFSLKDFKSAIKEAKGAISQQKASVHLTKPTFSNPSWSDLQDVLIKELSDNGIKVYVHSIKSPTTTTITTTTATATSKSSKPSTTKPSLKRVHDEISSDDHGGDVKKLEHELIKDIEPSEPIFEDVNAVIDSKTVSDLDYQRLEKIIKMLGGRTSSKWVQFGVDKTTHLICTGMSDLYLHVDRLGGLIILPDWIDQCFGSDKLLPLISEYIFSTTIGHPDYSNSLDNTANGEINQDDQDEKKVVTKSKVIKTPATTTTTISTTTVEPTISSTSASARPLKKQHLLSVFENCNIFFHENVNDKDTLKRYIIAYGGDISDSINSKTTHLVASLPNNFSNVKSKDIFKSNNNSSAHIVNSLWIWDSINSGELLNVKNYKL